jgi:pimeloyl-ACP methyl ester carboxylesterase
MFEGFTLETIALPEATLRLRHGGSGPPVLLLHGHPRTHTTWHMVAPLLARSHTVVCPDLRGFGRSSKADDTPDHRGSSKRAKARDCLALMQRLGFERFAVVGHDRGSYTAFRTAMDHPDAVDRLAVLDGVPILEALERCDARFATAWWHWFFFAQPEKPERAILADPDAWYGGSPEVMGAENYADYRATSTTRPRCTGCSKTTAPGSASIGRTTKRIGKPDEPCAARCSASGRSATIWSASTATCSRSGVRGRRTCAAAGSTAATIWRKRRRKRWPPSWGRSSAARAGGRASC